MVEQQQLLNFREFCHKQLDLPVKLAAKFIINDERNSNIPWFGKMIRVVVVDKYNPNTWKISLQNSINFLRLWTNLCPQKKAKIKEIKTKIFLDKHGGLEIFREELKNSHKKYYVYFGWVENHSRIVDGVFYDEDNSTVITHVYDWNAGIKIADHVWYSFNNDPNWVKLPVKKYIRFTAKTIKYEKQGYLCAYGLTNVKDVHILTLQERTDWKNRILELRKEKQTQSDS